MSVMALGGVWAGLTLFAIGRQTWGTALGIASIVAAFGCGFVSFSRGPVVIAAVIIVAWFLLSRAGSTILLRASGAAIGVLLLAWAFNLFPVFSELGQGLWERHQESGDTVKSRTFGQIQEAEQAMSVAP